MDDKIRKPHTSTKVKSRYNNKTYKSFAVRLKPDFYEELIDFCKERELSYSEFLKKALDTLKN